jgi:uncharacterized membrane protein YsdA (DUF1294 family)
MEPEKKMIQKLFFYYLIGINIYTFFLYYADKRFAIGHMQRISQKRLHLFALLGGFIGATFSMLLFRHKISKRSFLVKHLLIILLWVSATLFYFSEVDTLNFLR